MSKFVIKRIFNIIPILLGVSFIVFTIMSLTPGDPGRLILGPQAHQDAVDQLNKQLGYDKPFFARYFKFLKDVVTKLDFANSYRTGEPVFNEIIKKFPATFALAMLGIVFSALIGIPIGIYSAIKQYSAADTITTIIAMFLAAVPNFWFGMMLILLFSLKLGLLPSNGVDTWKNFILPTVTLALPNSAGILRLTRSTMLETIRQDYIRTARAKGAKELSIICKHALKNALLPIITVLGSNFGILLGGAVVSETVYAIPGLGTLLLTAIRSKDIPMVMAATIFLSFIYCIIILIVDILYGLIDPRVRAKYSK